MLGSQIRGVLDVVVQLSPTVLWIRRVIPDEAWILKKVLRALRESAWLFAAGLALHPENARELQANKAAWTAALGSWYLQPPLELRLTAATLGSWYLRSPAQLELAAVPLLARLIAKRESRDVAGNILRLQEVMNNPAEMLKRLR